MAHGPADSRIRAETRPVLKGKSQKNGRLRTFPIFRLAPDSGTGRSLRLTVRSYAGRIIIRHSVAFLTNDAFIGEKAGRILFLISSGREG